MQKAAFSNIVYPRFFVDMSRSRILSILVGIVVIGASAYFYFWYSRVSNDPTPDSIVGYGYAIAGTFFLLLAAVRYALYRRSRQRGLGQLNHSLNWHICFGVIGLSLLFMHSFGNFNPRTGTYALYGMIALTISGFIGRAMDHFLPRMIAREASKSLTEYGDDRIESISRRLQSIVVHNTREEVRAFKTEGDRTRKKRFPAADQSMPGLQTSWDLAYLSLEETPQEVRRDTTQYRFVPDRQSALARPGGLIPGAQEHMAELQNVQKALEREEVYRYVIRFWRIFHISLAILTVGMTLWHLEYATGLLIPTFFAR